MGSVEMLISQLKLTTETLIEPTLSAYSVSSCFIMFHIIGYSFLMLCLLVLVISCGQSDLPGTATGPGSVLGGVYMFSQCVHFQ